MIAAAVNRRRVSHLLLNATTHSRNALHRTYHTTPLFHYSLNNDYRHLHHIRQNRQENEKKMTEGTLSQRQLALEQKKYEQNLQFLLPYHVLPHPSMMMANHHHHTISSSKHNFLQSNSRNGNNCASPPSQYGEAVNRLIMRFDGCHFSAFTKPFHKPFDPFVHRALVHVAEDLLKHYPLTTVYVCSDEITAVFDGHIHYLDMKQQMLANVSSPSSSSSSSLLSEVDDRSFMGGRVQKMVSTCASFVSVRFKHHLTQLLDQVHESEYDRENHPVYLVESMSQIKNFWHEKPYYQQSMMMEMMMTSSGDGVGTERHGTAPTPTATQTTKTASPIVTPKTHSIKRGTASAAGHKQQQQQQGQQSVGKPGKVIRSTEQIKQHINDHLGIFDARVVLLPSDFLVLKNILWRSRYDCMRNSKTLLARCYYTPKAMHGISADDLVDRLYDEHKISWHDMPNAFKYGTFVKKETYLHTGVNPLTGEVMTTERHRPGAKSFLLNDAQSEDHHSTVLASEFLFAKRWDDIRDEFWKVCVQTEV